MSISPSIFDSPYYLIFHNSLQAAFFMSLRSDDAWLAALSFGGYDMRLATLLAVIGSTLGMSLNFGVGYYISRWRDELPGFSEKLYQRFCGIFRRYLFILMAVPMVNYLELMPGMSLYVMLCGMFRVPPLRALTAILTARILYYSYYLMQ